MKLKRYNPCEMFKGDRAMAHGGRTAVEVGTRGRGKTGISYEKRGIGPRVDDLQMDCRSKREFP